VTASTVIKSKSQYRIFFGKTFISLTFGDVTAPHQVIGASMGSFPIPVLTCSRSEDLIGNELILFGSDGVDGGYIYQMESGGSFDGSPIPAFMLTAYNNFKSPAVNKRYMMALFDCDMVYSSDLIKIRELVGYGNAARYTQEPLSMDLILDDLFGGIWNTSTWSNCYWGGSYGSEGEVELSGIASNIAFAIYSNSVRVHSINGISVSYSPRGMRK
jgi:hypothetical protein